MNNSVISIKKLLSTNNLIIPEYQRPYKWNIKNVNQLIDDILFFKKKDAYRLGTIVIHDDVDGKLNIVDGQQRTITLFLIALAIKNKNILNDTKKIRDLKINNLVNNFKVWKFKNSISQKNIQNNYRLIVRRLHEFDDDSIYFLFEKCEVVKVVLDDVSEAFQFFDSQNARGKDLEPHDLLKAFHLREMSYISENAKKESVNEWEQIDSEALSILFNNYLFRIRNWSKSRSARMFTKGNIDVFKGISLDNKDEYRYAVLHKVSNYYVDEYNKHYHRHMDHQDMLYPFQLDQVVINGKRFFEMISYYEKVICKFKKTCKLINEDEFDNEILTLIDEYEGKNRTGDKYVRNIFDCALIYYIDKFGLKDIDRIIEKLFIWAYSLRLKQYAVQLASIDNYVLGDIQVFKYIREAISPKDVLNLNLDVVVKVESSKTDKIEKKFQDLGYLNV